MTLSSKRQFDKKDAFIVETPFYYEKDVKEKVQKFLEKLEKIIKYQALGIKGIVLIGEIDKLALEEFGEELIK